jgi:FlaA1/EpsC-like NDP-sugar epimerase
VPYPITSTGARPGERLHEVLLSHNEVLDAGDVADGLRAVRSRRDPARLQALPSSVDELARAAELGDRDALRAGLMRAAEDLQ